MSKLNEIARKLIPENGSLNFKNILIVICIVIGAVVGGLYFILKDPVNENNQYQEKTNNERATEQSGTMKEIFNTKKEPEQKPTLENTTNEVLETKKSLQKEAYEQERAAQMEEEEELYIYNEPIAEQQDLRAQRRQQTNIMLVKVGNTSDYQNTNQKTTQDYLIPPLPGYPEPDENYQKKKAEFLKDSAMDNFVLQKPLTPAVSPYEVKAGTIIPLTLETGINSDLPGDITAIVKRDVYDSKTGRVLLIPGGSRVIGKYSSNVSFGQERVQVVFNRITLPNQKSVNIEAMVGVDQMGQSGVKDRVDTKLGKVFSSVVMSAILGAGTAVVTEENTDKNWQSEAGRGAGEQILNVGTTYTSKLLNVQPTLEIRPGYTVGIFVSKDILLEPYEN